MDNRYLELKKHRQLLNLMNEHGYVPQESALQVMQLKNIYAQFGQKIQSNCGSCLFAMAKKLEAMLNDYEAKEAKAKPIEVIEPIFEVKIIAPTNTKKKRR
jgi:bacterioferritin-associated ferredoxin